MRYSIVENGLLLLLIVSFGLFETGASSILDAEMLRNSPITYRYLSTPLL